MQYYLPFPRVAGAAGGAGAASDGAREVIFIYSFLFFASFLLQKRWFFWVFFQDPPPYEDDGGMSEGWDSTPAEPRLEYLTTPLPSLSPLNIPIFQFFRKELPYE